MIQRIQSLYMLLLILINFLIIISIDSTKEFSLPESYFGNFRQYINDYFFSELFILIILINVFLFKYLKIQLIILKLLFVPLFFGILNFFDERSIISSFKDPCLIYFFLSFFLIFITISSIKKDKSKINSLDRIR
ncbi:MAG: DUF4293 family protein [Flavobacteriaceae bacterium]|nr:DUF4293 family protein [Flavobacteriaceae bacterium]MBL6684166.1 DUF4293 family protein [Flavobacteriaceae bacterium]